MANRRATGKKAKHGPEMIQRCRAAILGALDVLENRGKKISDLLADEIEQNPIKFMELASKFMPKERHVSGEVNYNVKVEDMSRDELLAIAASGRTGTDTSGRRGEQPSGVH